MIAAVAVTGYGAVSGYGVGAERLAAAFEGRDCQRPITRFDASRPDGPAFAALVPDADALEDDADRVVRFAVAAAREAIAHAGVTPGPRSALLIGLTVVGTARRLDALLGRVGDALAWPGPRLAFGTACSGSTAALATGRELLLAGRADFVLAGGSHALGHHELWGFHSLGVLARDKCRPFGLPAGVVLGDGAAFCVLERGSAEPLAFLGGTALSTDGFHEAAPEPSGARLARTVEAALADAGLPAADVDAVSTHGTGSAGNDAAEWRGLARVFGAHPVHVVAPKALIGHTQTAAGALEAVLAVMGLERQSLPAATTVSELRFGSPPLLFRVPGPVPHETALSVNAAFGGANAVLVLTRRPRAGAPPREAPRVYVHGIGAKGLSRSSGYGHDSALSALERRHDLRGATPLMRLWIDAAASALTESGIRGSERVGLVAAATALSPSNYARFERSLAERGRAAADATTIPHLVPNAAAGGVARVLGLTGPHIVLASGPAAGLMAAMLAFDALHRRVDADAFVCGGADEAELEGDPSGAACVVLSRSPSPVRLASASLGAPGTLAKAAAMALSEAGLSAPDLIVTSTAGAVVTRALGAADVVSMHALAPMAPSYASSLALTEAASAVRSGAHRHVLLVADAPEGTVALVIVRGEP
ncbi:MAG: hypothetical protein IV100_13460 [Myxococcales bacterium]|nr:hypothetical protein [Myxococcales bacterium]